MAYPDFPFDPKLPSFLSHTQVLKYLEDYTDQYKLNDHIKVNIITFLLIFKMHCPKKRF